eukprot:10801341-Alexandrium_andersonii.AAC.1
MSSQKPHRIVFGIRPSGAVVPVQQCVDLRTEDRCRLAEDAWPKPLVEVAPELARALSLMIAANFGSKDGVWSDVRVSQAALD